MILNALKAAVEKFILYHTVCLLTQPYILVIYKAVDLPIKLEFSTKTVNRKGYITVQQVDDNFKYVILG